MPLWQGGGPPPHGKTTVYLGALRVQFQTEKLADGDILDCTPLLTFNCETQLLSQQHRCDCAGLERHRHVIPAMKGQLLIAS